MTVTISFGTGGALTLDGNGRSFIIENDGGKDSNLTPMPLFTQNSNNTEVFDFGGVIKVVNLQGLYVGTSKSDTRDFMNAIDALQNGQQDIDSGYPLTFTDPDARGTIKVKVMSGKTTKVAGVPLQCRWVLKLVEASDTA